MFKPVSTQLNSVALEQRILEFWKENDTFKKSLELRADAPRYVFFEGPPTANAPPGFHHVLARVFKDLFPRYHTMKGKYVLRKGGWDTHGLPVEVQVEKEIGSRGKGDIEKFGIAEFIQKCRASVWSYIQDWNRMTERIGFWVDLDDPYITYTNDYIESGWNILKTLWDRGLLFKDYKVSMHCPRCSTSLSDHEVALGFQDDVDDPSVWVKFKLKDVGADKPRGEGKPSPLQGAAILAWTTTPWTLPANVALAVNEYADYVVARVGEEKLVVAETLADNALETSWELVARVKGKDLVGLRYENLFNGVPAPGDAPDLAAAYRVIADETVSLEEGTGVVHIAPAYGDLEVGRRHNLPTLFSVDLSGGLMPEFGERLGAGKFFKDADVDLARDLKERGLLFREGRVSHSYPFCWRCDAPLLYYSKSSWYIKTTAVKERLLSANDEIHWYPDHIRTGRFGNWLENNIDWALTRERYWGTPFPVWQDAQGHLTCIGSVAELKRRAKNADALDWSQMDLHRPWVDNVILRCDQCGADMRRLPEVIDCWFDSGAMPYAQWHYPFANQDMFEDQFPADFISEAIDQTRGWFYSLHALGVLLKDTPVYKNCVVLGHIVDKDGQKMSKSKGNIIDPWYVLDNYGADAIRWYLYRTTSLGNPYRFNEDALKKEIVGGFLNTLWNTYAFFVTYANLDKFNPKSRQPAYVARPALDRWILAELHALARDADKYLAAYDVTSAARQIEQFVEDLSNWYVRRSRRRFWKGGKGADAQAAYHTLYECLVTLSKLLAPFMPFVAEEMYQNLARGVEKCASVHHADFPIYDARLIDDALVADTGLVVQVAALGRSARSKAQMKVRQPLARVLVKTRRPEERAALENLREQLLDELNVKDLAFFDDASAVLDYRVSLNPAKVGPKYGARMNELRTALAAFDPVEVARRVRANENVAVAGVELLPEELNVQTSDKKGYAVAEDAGLVVAVSTELTRELELEGMAREVVRHIQTMRKDANFNISDRIVTYYQNATGDFEAAIKKHGAYIRRETLSTRLVNAPFLVGAFAAVLELDKARGELAVSRTTRVAKKTRGVRKTKKIARGVKKTRG